MGFVEKKIEKKRPEVTLTAEEKAWLREHPVIRVHNETASPPFNFAEHGRPKGFSIDYMRLLAEKIGLNVEFTTGPSWDEFVNMMKTDDLDVMLNIAKTPEREEYLKYTPSYVTLTQTLYTRKDFPLVRSIEDLYGKKIAVPKGFYIADLLKDYPEVEILEVRDVVEAMHAVSTGKADALYDLMPAVNYLMNKLQITNLKVGGDMGIEAGRPMPLHLAVSRKNAVLAGILSKGIPLITDEEFQGLSDKWLGWTEAAEPELHLTPEEKAWLKEHPVISVSNEWNWPPLNYNMDGKPTGLSIDYMNLLASRMGIKVKYTSGEWVELLDQAFNKKLDVMLNIVITPERQKYLLYTRSYVKNPNVIIAREGSSVSDTQSLFGKTVAYPEGFFYDEVLKTEFPEIIRVPMKDTLETLKAIQFGKVDAALCELAVANYLIRENLLTSLAIKGGFESGNPETEKLNIAVRNDWPILATILDKALLSITPEEHRRLAKRWMPSDSQKDELTHEDNIRLTDAERTWLAKHRVLRLGADSAWPPYDFFDASGKQRGVAADVMALLSKRLDIKFDLLPDLTWTQVLEAGRDRRLDVISILVKTPTREKYLKFSKPLLKSPYVIVTNKNFRSVKNLGDMTKDKVAMAKDFAIVELSRKAFPDLNIIMVKTPLAGLEAVMSNQVDAYIDNLGVVGYLIEQNGLTNLKIAAQAGVKSPPFHIGVRSDWPELVSIINKGLESITKAEMNAILNKWIPITMSAAKSESDLPLSFGKLLGYAGATLIAIILLALVFLKLSKQESMLAGFGSRRFRSIVIAGLCFFVLIVASLGWFALTRIKAAVLQGVGQNLKRVLLISEEGLGVWEADRKAFMKQLGRDPELVRLVEELLTIPPNPESLLTSKALEKVRHYFKNNKDIFSNIGFFIISPQDISIGSMRNSNVGTRNLIVDKYPGLIQKALDGQVNFVPAMESDVQLKEVPDSKQKRKPPTMFFIGPIQNSTGKTIAAMTLRVDPLKDFSKILGMLGRKGTEETYAFDVSGRLVTDTKFDTQLREIGLIEKDQTAALNLEIRDPGGNMLEGHHPASERSSLPLTRAAAGAIALKARMEAAGATFGHSNIEVDIGGYPDYRGVPVVGAWVWDKNLELGIAAEIGFDEALSNYFRVRFIILTVLGLTLVLFLCSTLFVLAMGERTHKSLIEAKDTLEDKVEERTAELAEKQELLQTAEERSRLLLHSAGEGIFGVDKEGVCIFANPAALNLLGYSEEELIGKNIHPTIHHSHEDGTIYLIQHCPMFKSFTEGTAHRVANEVLWRKDGSHFPVEYASTPMEKNGSLVGAVITFADITERRAAEERFSALLESAPDAMIVTDEAGNIVLVNSETEAVFGYSRAELIGKKIEMLVPEEIRDVHPDYRTRFYADRKRFSMGFRSDFYGVAKDGRKMPMDIGLSPIETAEGLLVVASVRDITERRRMEKALSEEHERLQRILDTCPVAVVISVDGIIQYSNEFLTEFFGLKKGDMPIDIYVNPEDRDYVIKELERTGMVRNYELKAYDSKGGVCDVLSYYFKIEYNGKPAILSWWVDTTEMKETTKELEIKFDELTRFRRLAVGREHMMIELKKEINQLLTESGRPEEYKIH